ncbi:zinc finger protein 692-like [Drosophila tropicalis]|uniref:zinc finger protein 692-like n=1 Tax=Drosophila tropicalis TaxID=46794 RepID=UPI0035ABD53C
MSYTFELPKTPASTIDGHGYDSDDDDVQITAIYGSLKPTYIDIVAPTTVEPMQLPVMGIATPPQSPPYPVGMPPHAAHESMPLLSELLSNSNIEAPQGYIISVPCYLCKQPFNDIERLKEHLSIHADIINQTALAEATVSRETPQNRQSAGTNILYSCEFCGKIVNSKCKLSYHRRYYHREAVIQKRAQLQQAKEANRPPDITKCHLCRKQYKRLTFLKLHLKRKHGVDQESPAPPTSSESSLSSNSTESITSTELAGRQVWSTNLLNSLAAAQYNPANETAQKYMSSSEAEPRQQHKPIFEPEPKYPLRSPFFNPNLWIYGFK